jgi:hypothetical protein
VGSAFAQSIDVKSNGKVVTTLYSGSYYPYFTDPGEIEFSAKTEASDEVTIDAKANQTYFLRGSVGIGFFVGASSPNGGIVRRGGNGNRGLSDAP